MKNKEEIIKEIDESHKRTRESVDKAKDAMQTAIDDSMQTSHVVTSLQRQFKHTIRQELAGTSLNSSDVDRYLTLGRLNKKRGALVDKRQMTLIGFYEPQEPTQSIKQATPSKTVSVIMTGAVRDINKKLKNRPLSEWHEEEKQQFKRDCAPIIQILNNI